MSTEPVSSRTWKIWNGAPRRSSVAAAATPAALAASLPKRWLRWRDSTLMRSDPSPRGAVCYRQAAGQLRAPWAHRETLSRCTHRPPGPGSARYLPFLLLPEFRQEPDLFVRSARIGRGVPDLQAPDGHWRLTLSVAILDISYEAFVTSPEPQVQRLLEFCELPWEPRCLEFHKSPRYVNTASYDQVRQPLYRSSIGRWRHYEAHLGGLIEALS